VPERRCNLLPVTLHREILGGIPSGTYLRDTSFEEGYFDVGAADRIARTR